MKFLRRNTLLNGRWITPIECWWLTMSGKRQGIIQGLLVSLAYGLFLVWIAFGARI